MKKTIAAALVLGLVGCASSPSGDAPVAKHQDLVLDKHVNPMSRNEVISAVTECHNSGLRASMIYGKRKVNGYTTDIVVDVTCAPKY